MSAQKPLLQALSGKTLSRVPLWLMRQAGRYLPEYRAVREKTASFLDLCLTPELAAEVTLQPLRRFPLDAAIIFSDILVVPHALGQKVSFEEGRGPVLEPLRTAADLARLSAARSAEVLAPVEAALRQVAAALPEGAALIGFAGAPWTVASYMIEGGSSRDFAEIKRWAYGDPGSFQRLIGLLVEVTSDYLVRQVDAGAEALQIFDSWAGVLPERALAAWALTPTAEIVRRVKAARPGVPVIVFPRGIGTQYAVYAESGSCDALSLDPAVPLDWAGRELQPRVALQGNLDPMLLVVGGAAMREETKRILEMLAKGPFVFNLGHGIVPQTPIDHVAELCELVHGWRP
jgi:uroporphyrinogen decarboxylase